MNLSGLRFARKDSRDLVPESPEINAVLEERGFRGFLEETPTFDLSTWFSPLENQGNLGACSAHAVIALFEYYDRRAFQNNYTDLSRLFLYKITRNLMGVVGDTGADMRTAMRATHRIGICPEKYFPYKVEKFDDEPQPFHYSLAQNYRATHYLRLDKVDSPETTLARIKAFIRVGLPSCFGFICFESLDDVGSDGNVPFPKVSEQIIGGHAIVAAGFDDTRIITHPLTKVQTKGAIKFPNSWSLQWGEQGWGWLPYEYILRGFAFDFWALLRTSAPYFLDWD